MSKIAPIRTRVATVTCNNCKDEIFSRARHDMRACSCGQTTIDGGFNYVKVGFNPNAGPPQHRIRYVNASEQGLYDDWNHRRNLFGKITPKKAKHHA